MLHFLNFEKSYGNTAVLNIQDLTLQPGIYWIKGVNGSGKSTLLKTLAGILSFRGDILLNTHSIKKDAVTYRKRVNFAEAEPLFPEFLTGLEMIRLFVSAKDAPRAQEDFFIESMRMQDYIHQPVRTYSSGMLKKLSLVLAFLGKPEWILLDEPLITMDAASLDVLYRWIAEKHQQEKISFMLSSHQPLEMGSVVNVREILVERRTVNFVA